MNTAWAVCIPRGEERQLAALRGFAGLEVAECGDAIWLLAGCAASGFHQLINSQGDGELLDRALRALPGARYRVLADGQLVPEGQRVPRGRLPSGEWTPLVRWLQVKLPAAALPGRIEQRVALRLVRTADEQRPSALVTALDRWIEYCLSAPEVRLRPLAFAVSGDRRAFVTGSPLPSLPGERYVVSDGVAVPCGYALQPRIGGTLLRRLLQLEQGDLALFAADGSFERIAHDDLVAASRGAARATAAAFGVLGGGR